MPSTVFYPADTFVQLGFTNYQNLRAYQKNSFLGYQLSQPRFPAIDEIEATI